MRDIIMTILDILSALYPSGVVSTKRYCCQMNWKSKKPSQLVFFGVASANDSVPCSHHQKCLNHKYILLTEKNRDRHSPFSWLVPAISDKYKDSKCKSNDTVSMKLYLLSLVWLGIFHRRWWKNGVVILKFLGELSIRIILRNLLLCTRDTVIRARDIKKYQLRCFFWFPIHMLDVLDPN